MNDEKFADLHIHTCFSDGAWTPYSAVQYAISIKLSCISITDHDSIDAIEETLLAASKENLEIVPGIELSAMIENPRKCEVHILGYYIDYKSQELKSFLDFLKEERLKRAYKILDALKGLGIVLKDKKFLSDIENKAVGRLHFAKALINENFVSNIKEAFFKYLSRDKPAYIPKYPLSYKEALQLIINAKGIPVIAHPYFIPYNNKDMWNEFKKEGAKGIEVWHTKHPPDVIGKLLAVAEEFDFLATGGSDCHGIYKDEHPLMGKIKVGYDVVEKLKTLRKKQ